MAYTVVDKGSKYFDTSLYTGTGSSQSISNLNFQPDFTWIKGRSGATDHALYDAVRGVQKDLVSNATSAETTQTTGLTAFGSTGFTIGALAKLNTSSATYCSWNWLASNTTVSNTAGSITSTVSANTTSGFSVVSYTGNRTPTADQTIGHGLGAVPTMMIVKNRTTGTRGWRVYHKSLGTPDKELILNSTAGVGTDTATWGNTTPTSSVFYVGASGETNNTGDAFIAYCFADVKGYSKFGSYTGNGNSAGTFVYTGFKPAFVLVKSSSSADNWFLMDNKRDPFNPEYKIISPNTNSAEDAANPGVTDMDLLSNGFRLTTNWSGWNNNGQVNIYMAFAENPFVSSKGLPCTAR